MKDFHLKLLLVACSIDRNTKETFKAVLRSIIQNEENLKLFLNSCEEGTDPEEVKKELKKVLSIVDEVKLTFK